MANDNEQRRRQGANTIDADALTAIYDEFHQPIYRYIYRQVSDVDTARDLTADVFRRLLQAVKRGKGPEQDLKAWLYRTAHNGVIDHYRRQQFRKHLPLNEQIVAAGDDPVSVAEQQVAAERLRNAIQKLTPEQQEVITLKFLAGFGNQEVSAVMNKPVGAVKSLQHRALAALRRQLTLTKEKTL